MLDASASASHGELVRAPKVILFDAAGTLFHLPKGAGWHYAEVARRHGLELDPQTFETAFRAGWKRAPSPPESEGPRADDDRGWWRALVDDVLNQLGGVPELNRARYFDELWSEFTQPGVWELYPETHEIVSRLANRHRLGVLSNFDSRLHSILSDLGLGHFFEHVIVSSEVGAEKPSPRMFAEAADRFDVRPEEILHVGDEPEADWRGAATAGFQTFKLRRPENSLRDLENTW